MAIASQKGSSSLANSFLKNKATQPQQDVPTITQPQSLGLPDLPEPKQQAPVMGSMAPANDKPNYLHLFGPAAQTLGRHMGMDGPPTPVTFSGMEGEWIRQRTPNGMEWVQAPQTQGMQQGATQQQSSFPSQAQILAQAINERARNR